LTLESLHITWKVFIDWVKAVVALRGEMGVILLEFFVDQNALGAEHFPLDSADFDLFQLHELQHGVE
jgi:hypothetical protein